MVAPKKKIAGPADDVAPHPTRSVPSARAYLMRERPARGIEIVDAAAFFAERVRESMAKVKPIRLERAKARTTFAAFRRRLAKGSPSMLRELGNPLSEVERRLSGEPGKPLEGPARFARAMLTWGALEFGDTEPQLTASELMAAATVAGPDFQAETEGGEVVLDYWIKLRARRLPRNPARLAHEGKCIKASTLPTAMPDGTTVPPAVYFSSDGRPCVPGRVPLIDVGPFLSV